MRFEIKLVMTVVAALFALVALLVIFAKSLAERLPPRVLVALGVTLALLSVGGGAFLLSRYYVETFDLYDFRAHTNDVYSPRFAIVTDVLFACGVAFVSWARLPRLAAVLALAVGVTLTLKPVLYPFRRELASLELTYTDHLHYLIGPGVAFVVWAVILVVGSLRQPAGGRSAMASSR